MMSTEETMSIAMVTNDNDNDDDDVETVVFIVDVLADDQADVEDDNEDDEVTELSCFVVGKMPKYVLSSGSMFLQTMSV